MKALLSVCAFACVLLSAQSIQNSTLLSSQTPARERRVSQKKVLIIGIDGCRPDALAAAATPNLDSLISAGTIELAQTGDITVSGPGWSSMLTAVWRDKHGVDDNSFAGSNFGQYPHVFTRIKQQNPLLFTASIVAWTPIQTFIVSDADVGLGNLSDAGVATQAASLVSTGNPDITFLHFDQVDIAGHGFGYSPGIPQYLAAIETVDSLVGTVLTAVQSRPTYPLEDWLVLVSTDHGGIGNGHGGNTPEERTIFVIASGTAFAGKSVPQPVNIVDIPPTAVVHLGLEIDAGWDWDGIPMQERVPCPFDLNARPDHFNKKVELSWSGGDAGGGFSIEVYRNDQLVATLPSNQQSYSDTPPSIPTDIHSPFEYRLQVAGRSCVPISKTVDLSGGQVVFADDFENYASDFDLVNGLWNPVDVNNPIENSTWTVTNPGGKQNPPTKNGRASCGQFVISDSDTGGSPSQENTPGSGMSHDLLSPPFDCSSLTEVFLHASCTAQLNDNGEAVFDIDVSTDGGQSWNNAFRRIAPPRSAAPFANTTNANGFFGRLDLDLTVFAAGENDVRLRFRHFEPSWDWWIALDDLIVDDVDLKAPCSTQILSTATFSPGIPLGWTLQGLNSGTETWHTTDKGNRYNAGNISTRGVNRLEHPGALPDFAMLESDANPDPAEDEYLITPTLNCTPYARVKLHFASETVPDDAVTAEVLVSLDGGASFLNDAVFSYSTDALLVGGQEPVFEEHVLLVPQAAGQASVAFAFRYQSPGNRWWWAVDEVSVTGE